MLCSLQTSLYFSLPVLSITGSGAEKFVLFNVTVIKVNKLDKQGCEAYKKVARRSMMYQF